MVKDIRAKDFGHWEVTRAGRPDLSAVLTSDISPPKDSGVARHHSGHLSLSSGPLEFPPSEQYGMANSAEIVVAPGSVHDAAATLAARRLLPLPLRVTPPL
jgi:hypothetical protein